MEENKETQNTEVEVQKTEEQLKEEQRRKIEEIKAKLEALRLPLNEQTSTDVIQRINALTNILKLTVSVPKFTQERVGKDLYAKLSGSAEISVFPFYGEYDEQYREFCYNTYVNILMRITELATKL